MSGLPEYVRVFTAVELDPEIRDALAGEAADLLRDAGRVTRVARENLHVTLKFVGDVHRDDLPALGEAVAAGAQRLRPGEVEVRGVGAFPGLARPRVIWAGVSDPSGILSPVHAFLNEALASFGAKRDRKRYVPHVTLARVRGPFDADLLTDRLDRSVELWFGSEDVTAVTLFMSELERGRPPRYTVLGRYGPGGSQR
jgi:2'-5' RNA ligase